MGYTPGDVKKGANLFKVRDPVCVFGGCLGSVSGDAEGTGEVVCVGL